MHNSKKNNLIKSSVRQALFILLLEKNLKEIKITDVVKKAGVSRASFYRYYPSLDAVLKDAINSQVMTLKDSLTNNFTNDLKKIVSAFRKYKKYLEILLKSGYFHLILDIFNQQFEDKDFYHYAWSGMIYNILYYWVDSGMHEAEEDMVNIISQVTMKISNSL